MNLNLIPTIVYSVREAQSESLVIEDIFSTEVKSDFANEFLFFIKPEITLRSNSIKLSEILELVFSKIKEFNLSISNVRILSAKYLKDYNIIAQHYGVINRIARNAKNNLSESSVENFEAIYNRKLENSILLGGIEFLEKYKDFNPNSLDFLWQNKKCEKLAGGTYIEDIKIDDDYLYLVNGFHPRQLQQYIEHGRSIIVMTLFGNTDWKTIRESMIGSTFPGKAKEGSIRKELLNKKEQLGLAEVSQALNGVHLSAGPVESLIELCRYNSDFTDDSKVKHFYDYSFGKKLKGTFTVDSFTRILSNSNVQVSGKSISVFDLTEEKNSDEAIELLKKYFN